MTSRSKIGLGAAAAMVAAAVAGLMLSLGQGPKQRGQLEQVAELVWPDGMELRFELEHSAQSRATVSLPAQDGTTHEKTVDGATSLLAQLVVEPSTSADGTRLHLRLESVREARIEVLGQNAAPSKDDFEKHSAVVEIARAGNVRELRFSRDSPEIYRNMMQVLVSELQVNLQPGHRWQVEERTMQGLVASQYSASGSEIRRTRQAFVDGTLGEISGSAAVELNRQGYLESMSSVETVSVQAQGSAKLSARSETSIKLLSAAKRATRERVATTRAYRLGELATTDRMQQQHLESRIGGLTRESLLETLNLHASAGKVPNHNRFLWQATGLLAANPSLCDELVSLFERPGMSGVGHNLILDLLVGAGTSSAQAAIRAAVASQTADHDQAFGLLYQRFALLSAPDAETMSFVRARYRKPGAEGADAAAHAYGAVIGRRLAGVGDDEARDAVWSLTRDMTNAETSATRASLLGALGNVGATELEPHIAVYLDDQSAAVRRAAASALRHIQTDSASDALVELVDDADGTVQRRALASLSGRILTGTQLDSLTEGVSTGALRTASLDPLLDILQREPQRDRAQQVLAAVAARSSATKGQRARARSMMALQR